MEEHVHEAMGTEPEADPGVPSADDKKIRFRIAMTGFVLFIIFVIGIFWFLSNPQMGAGLTLSFIAGLTMIFLPCTLPMAFVIVPMTLGKAPLKGFLMALFFGLGLAITLSFYGVFIAAIGQFLGLTAATQIMLIVGGGASLFFGISEIGLIKFRLPSYTGKFPDFIQKQGDYIKVFLLGLFLGNAGVGCPNPAFYVLMGYIATVGDLFNGWFLGFVHGVGRAVPLIFLAILGILGINATSKIAGKQEVIEKYMGWVLIFIGAFILTFGLFGHDWFVSSGFHTSWEKVVVKVAGEQFGENILQHTHRLVNIEGFIDYGNMFFLGLIGIIIALFAKITKPSRKFLTRLLILYAILILSIGYMTGWTWKLSPDVTHHDSRAIPGEQEAVVPLGLDGASIQDDGTVRTADGGNADGAHVMPDGTVMTGSGEAIEGAHVMPDGTVMVMQKVSASVISSLPKRGPADRVSELPFVMKDGVKEFRLTVDEIQWEYEPGRYIHAWAYNGQVPGPTIRATEGEKVRVIVKNNLPDATTIHWHGQAINWKADGVPNLTQKPIQPGEEFVYEFSPKPEGTKWYHSHGNNEKTVAQQVDMGLSGVFIIEPKEPTVEYDREYILLLDEWNILPGGVNPAIGHVHGAATPGAVPDFNTFTINGRVFPYIDPIKVKEGEKVLIRIVNGGTSAFHPMHTHGHDFELVALDGNPVPKAAIQKRNVYTIHPGETADFLLTADNPGNWLFHCHHAHHAAAGMVMLIEYEGFDGPTTDDLRKMKEEAADIAGIHIMADGTVMLGSGEKMEGAEVTEDGMIKLPSGKMVTPVMDMREGSSMGEMEMETADHVD